MYDGLNAVLMDREQVLWQGRPDSFCFVWRSSGKLLPIALIWLLFDGFFIGTLVSTGAAGEMWPFLVLFFGLHLLPVWGFIAQLVKARMELKNVVYAITDKRILVRNGVVGIDFETVNYTDISAIRVNVSLLEKIRKVGSVFVTTSSGSIVCLTSVSEPYMVFKKANTIFMDVKSDIEYPNAYRPDSNPGYHTEYKN